MLEYDIQSETLRGNVGREYFLAHAVSGGGRGSKLKPEGDERLRSWTFWTKENQAKGIRGGIIPPGFYICRHVPHHTTFHECIFLEQTLTSIVVPDPGSSLGIRMHDRDGFYIHSRGPKGSDGCIVLSSEAERHRLNRAIKDHPATALRVVHPYLPDSIAPARGMAYA
jgi:hypothetical protein